MNRQTLADATSLHDAPVPVYLMEDIANGTKMSQRDADKTADFLLNRLGKSNPIVKLKALQIISFCIREGGPDFAEAIREEESEISAYLQFSGPPDPVMGDERYRRIRVASQETLVCLNDGSLPRRNAAPPQGGNGQQWGQSQPPVQQQPGGYGQTASGPDGPHGSYDNSNKFGSNAPPQQQWGANSSSSGASRPMPYSDNPSSGPPSSGGYGGPQNQYGGQGGFSGYGNQGNAPQGYGGARGYGNDGPGQQPPHQQQQQQQSNGFGSWAAPSPTPSYGAPKASSGGMWSSSGYQKSAAPPPAPSFSTSRDNRPTVLVGHNINFPKPVSFGNSSLIGGVSGSRGGFGSQHMGGGGGMGGTGMGGGGPDRFSGPVRQTPSYADNTNHMLSGSMQNSTGIPTNMQHALDSAAASKLGKTVEGLKKIGNEAKGRWDRRNMDKSMGSSLADHDELSAAPQAMDRGYFQPPSLGKGTGGGDTSGEYERGLIDSLCASVGLARAPPAEALKRFIELAQTLDVQTIGDIMLDKLEDPVWQVRLKALHVVLALLDSPGSSPYLEFFEDNAGVFEELRGDGKPTVASKALQVMRALGLADESTPEPKRAPVARATSVRSAASAHGSGGDEVDFLGFGALDINDQSAHTPAAASSTAPNMYSSPSSGHNVASPVEAPPQEVSLLDGFDIVPQTQQPPQQYQQQQGYYQQDHAAMVHHDQAPAPEAPQQEYGDLLPMSPPLQSQAPPMDTRSKALSNFGKDLFTLANSPRSSNGDGGAPPTANRGSEQSAFNFM